MIIKETIESITAEGAQISPPIPQSEEGPIPGAKVLLIGPPGSGKSHSLKTLLGLGLDVFGVFTEQNSLSVAGPWLSKLKAWHFLSPIDKDPGWGAMRLIAQRMHSLDQSAQCEGHINRSKYNHFINLIGLMNNFVSSDGKSSVKSYGDVGDWNTDRVLFIDSMTGLTKMARKLTVGDRVTLTLPEYGSIQMMLLDFIDKLLQSCRCHFVLTAHIERIQEELTGKIHQQVETLGRKLGPALPVNFNDCIQVYKQGAKFNWRTTAPDMALKTNHLPNEQDLPQDFGPILQRWKANGGVISPTT